MNSEKLTVKDNPIFDRAVDFALRMIELYKVLVYEKKEYVMSKQLLKSGTSIGANLKEAELSISKKEFIAKAQPFTLHRSPFTIHPSPFTLHRSPFTVHPSPFTVHLSAANNPPTN